MGFILTQWGMEVFNVFHSFCICNDLALSLIFTSFFPCLMGFSLSFSFSFHVHLWSTAKLNCLSLRRWTTLAMPGWQATRKAPWMGNRQRGRVWHLSDEIRCPGCPPVDAPARWWGHWLCFRSSGGRGATSVSNLFHGGKTWKNFRSSCEVHVPSHVEYHHNLNESICWVHLQGRYMSISRIARISRSISWKFERLL